MRKTFFNFTLLLFILCQFSLIQAEAQTTTAGRFTIGERLTYNISFANFATGAYAELHVVSQGKYANQNAVYLQGKVKTNEVVNAALINLDETRQTLVSAETGLPLYSKRIFDESTSGREKIVDYKGAATGFDWLSAIYQMRFSGDSGTITIQEGDEISTATYKPDSKFSPTGAKSSDKTAAGEFETTVIAVQHPLFPGLKIHFTNDAERIPVVMTYKHPKGQFRIELASIQNTAPEPILTPTPRPQVTPTPIPLQTPRPRPTPTPYINNQPLSADMPFNIGETLTYRLSRPNTQASFGTMTVQAKERRQYNGRDSLLVVTSIPQITEPNSVLTTGDTIRSYVDPESLLPIRTEIAFKGTLSQFNQTLSFDQTVGKVTDNRAVPVDVPVGTHDILSLAYAIRSFNLKDARPTPVPGTDTRVAVYTVDGPLILTILPQPEETLDYLGQKVVTQVVFTNIGQTTVKLWLSKEPGRLPLRLSIASPLFAFTADLVSVVQVPPIDSGMTPGLPGTGVTPQLNPGIQGIPGFPGVSPNQIINANPIGDPTIKKP